MLCGYKEWGSQGRSPEQTSWSKENRKETEALSRFMHIIFCGGSQKCVYSTMPQQLSCDLDVTRAFHYAK